MNKPSDIPDIYVKCTSIDDLYRLKPRKKSWIEDNIELDIGLPVLKYSFVRGEFRKYELCGFDALRPDYFKSLIEKGLIYAGREALDRSEKRHREVERDEFTAY